MQSHGHQLVQEVKVQELNLRKGGVQEGEGLEDQRPMLLLPLEKDSQEVPDSLIRNVRLVGVIN